MSLLLPNKALYDAKYLTWLDDFTEEGISLFIKCSNVLEGKSYKVDKLSEEAWNYLMAKDKSDLTEYDIIVVNSILTKSEYGANLRVDIDDLTSIGHFTNMATSVELAKRHQKMMRLAPFTKARGVTARLILLRDLVVSRERLQLFPYWASENYMALFVDAESPDIRLTADFDGIFVDYDSVKQILDIIEWEYEDDSGDNTTNTIS